MPNKNTWLGTVSIMIVTLLLLSGFGILVGNVNAAEPDSDFDGLSDDYERAIGTDPNNPDTDADGIPDADDPTPKGGMLNTEEVWDTWDIKGYLEVPVVKAGNAFNITFTVTHLLPDGTVVIPDILEATLYIYDTRSYYTLSRVMKRLVMIENGSFTFSHTSIDPAKYYFILAVNASQITLGKHATSYEIIRLAREMKLGYVYGAAYPPYFTTVESIYPILLPGHRAHYLIKRYAYSPENRTHDFLSRFINYYTPAPVLDQLYALQGGTGYLHLFKSGFINKTTVNISEEGLYYDIPLMNEGGYNLAATAYDVAIPWDFSYSPKFPFSRAYTRIINSTVSWIDLPSASPDVYDNITIGLHKYSITTTMNESDFHQWYRHGGLRGIAEDHPEHATPHKTDIWVSLFYYVYVSGRGSVAYTMFDRKLPLDGHASTNYELELPGRYLVGANYHPQQPHHPGGTFELYEYHGYRVSGHYNDLRYFYCDTDVYLNAFKSKNVYFTSTGTNVSVTGTEGHSSMVNWDMAVYVDNAYNRTVTFSDNSETVDIGKLGKGKHYFRAVTIFSPKTRTIVEALGVKNFPYNWIGHTSFQVKDLLLYVNTPSTLVEGHIANMSVLVYGPGPEPVGNVNVVVHMDGYHVPRVRVTSGLTGADGSVKLGFFPPAGNYHTLEVTASKGQLSEYVSTYAWIRSERHTGYIHTNKPVYLPGDTIYGQLSLFDVDNAVPLAGPVEVRFVYDGNGKDIIRENHNLDRYGTAAFEFPVSKDAPWGTYRISVYWNDDRVLSREVGVRYYETPDTRIVFDQELSLRTGEMEIPVKVEYMFGAPVYQGTVIYRIEGYENRYQYSGWDWWGCERNGDMDGIFDYGWWWYDPGPVFTVELNRTVEEGWGNITLDIPKGIKRITIEADFSDDYDHTCEASTTYYVGEAPDPELKTGINITPAKEPFTAVDQPVFSIHAYNYKEREKGDDEIGMDVLGGVGTVLLINVTSYDINGVRGDEALFNITTDREGNAEIDLNAMGVDTFNLSARGRYYFKMEVSVAGDNTPPATAEHEFFIHTVIYEVETSPDIFVPNTNATITLHAESLVPTVDVNYNYTLAVCKRERYFGYFDDYYYSSYDGSPVFAVSGSASGPVNVTWKLPEFIESGRYVIKIDFENGDYLVTVEHPVEIVELTSRKITLTPTQDRYVPGDNIDVQVSLSEEFKGYVYLLASVGWDSFLKSRYINGKMIQFTLNTKDWHHALDIDVFLVDEMARVVSSKLTIGYGLGPLSILLEMNRTDYEPGEKAQLVVTVLDSQGTPVPAAQVSLAVVDAAVFELFQDSSAKGYYGSLVTPWEFEWSYRTLVNWDSDTWYPKSLPSETISYWPNQIPYWSDPMDAEYDNDGMTNGAGQGQGQGGGGEEAPKDATLDDALQSELDNTDVREWFTDTALWNTSMLTGNDGKAHINLTLPDNIGKWRIRGTGRTLGLPGGENVAYFNVSKDFFIEPKLPYKVTQDDEIEFKVLVYNFHKTEINAELGMSAGNWIKVFGVNQVTVRIPSNSITEHTYRVKIFGAMTNNLTFIASDLRGNTDAVRKEMFVTPNGALHVSHATGAVDPAVTETLNFRTELINGTQKTVLRLAPGYQGLLKMGFSMLAGYPYDCTEQITSRMIPAILYREYLKEKGELNRWTDRYLTRKVYIELQSLLAKQHPDGGWGWWQGDNSALWMSGWVLLGLTMAKESGFFVDQRSITSCQNYLVNNMGPDGTWKPGVGDDMKKPDLTAFLYYPLVRSGVIPLPVQMALEQYMMEGELTSFGIAMYGLSSKEQGMPVGEITGELGSRKIGSHLESDEALGGSVETTAWTLYLLAMENSNKSFIRELVEWLNSRRLSTGDFGTTTATVAYMFSILEVLKNAQPINMDITVTVNGVHVADEHVDDRTYREFYNKLDALDITQYLHTDRPNNITVRKRGTGELFYELTTVEYLRKEVHLNFSTNISVNSGDTFAFAVVADPVNSPTLDVEGLDLRMHVGSNLVYLNSRSSDPTDPDSPRTFTFNYLARGTGTARISPIIMTYKLTAGQRESGLITKYYGPVTVNIKDVPMRNDGSRGLTGDPEMSIGIVKTADQFAVAPGERVNINLEVRLEGTADQRKDLGNVTIKDYYFAATNPETKAGGPHYMTFMVDTSLDYQKFTYSAVCDAEYRGDLGTAVLMSDDSRVLAYSQGSPITVSSDEYFIQRSYSADDLEVFTPMMVKIKAWSDEKLMFMAVEDYLPPGFEADDTSLDGVVKASDGNILSYESTTDKVTFFVKTLEDMEIAYKVVPTIPGRFVAAPTLMFPMYSPDTTAQSDSHRITVNPEGRSWGGKYVEVTEEEEVEPPENDDDEDDDGDTGGDDDVGNPVDIPVDINPPDGPGDGDPEPVVEEDDDDADDDTEVEDDDDVEAEGPKKVDKDKRLREVLSAVSFFVLLILLIGLLLVVKRKGRKRGGDGYHEGTEGDEPPGAETEKKISKKTSSTVVTKRRVKSAVKVSSKKVERRDEAGCEKES